SRRPAAANCRSCCPEKGPRRSLPFFVKYQLLAMRASAPRWTPVWTPVRTLVPRERHLETLFGGAPRRRAGGAALLGRQRQALARLDDRDAQASAARFTASRQRERRRPSRPDDCDAAPGAGPPPAAAPTPDQDRATPPPH